MMQYLELSWQAHSSTLQTMGMQKQKWVPLFTLLKVANMSEKKQTTKIQKTNLKINANL